MASEHPTIQINPASELSHVLRRIELCDRPAYACHTVELERALKATSPALQCR
jgi:hypothetical protein